MSAAKRVCYFEHSSLLSLGDRVTGALVQAVNPEAQDASARIAETLLMLA
jgi:hypothetical protein